MRRQSVSELKILESRLRLTPALAAVMFRAVWNFALSTSNLLKCQPQDKDTCFVREHSQAVCETPQEEQDCDQCDWEDRLSDGQG